MLRASFACHRARNRLWGHLAQNDLANNVMDQNQNFWPASIGRREPPPCDLTRSRHPSGTSYDIGISRQLSRRGLRVIRDFTNSTSSRVIGAGYVRSIIGHRPADFEWITTVQCAAEIQEQPLDHANVKCSPS